MNKQETLKKLIREEVRKELIKESDKSKLNEGLLEKLLMAFLSPMIKREVKKIKNDPDIIAAQQSVQYAVDNYVAQLKRSTEYQKSQKNREEKEYEEFRKSLNKK